jgi:uncharacterized membrane protein
MIGVDMYLFGDQTLPAASIKTIDGGVLVGNGAFQLNRPIPTWQVMRCRSLHFRNVIWKRSPSAGP